MQVGELRPLVSNSVIFRRDEMDKVLAGPGCYVLADRAENILYLGASEVSVRARFYDHLADDDKKGVCRFYYGRADNPRRTEAEWLEQYARRSGGNKPPLHD